MFNLARSIGSFPNPTVICLTVESDKEFKNEIAGFWNYLIKVRDHMLKALRLTKQNL